MRRPKQRAIEPRADVDIMQIEIGRSNARHRDEDERQPVTDEQGSHDSDLLWDRGAQREERAEEVRNTDALEHAGDAQRGEGRKEGKCVERDANERNQGAAPQDPQDERTVVRSAPSARLVRKGCADADDKQEEWKDEVGGCPSMPWGVLEWRIDGRPTTRVV